MFFKVEQIHKLNQNAQNRSTFKVKPIWFSDRRATNNQIQHENKIQLCFLLHRFLCSANISVKGKKFISVLVIKQGGAGKSKGPDETSGRKEKMQKVGKD